MGKVDTFVSFVGLCARFRVEFDSVNSVISRNAFDQSLKWKSHTIKNRVQCKKLNRSHLST